MFYGPLFINNGISNKEFIYGPYIHLTTHKTHRNKKEKTMYILTIK